MGCQVTRQPDVQWGRWQHANTKCPISLLSRENIDAGNEGKVGSGAHCPGLPTVDYSTTSPGGIPAPHQIYHGLACIRRGELGSVCSAVDLHAGVRVSVRVRGW